MNILYHHRTRGVGAEGAHIRGIVDAFRSLGHQVNILSFPGADPELKPTAKQHVVKKPKTGLAKWLAELTKHLPEWGFEGLELLYNLMAVLRLYKAIRQQHIDFIYERYSLFMFAGVWLARKKNIPIILEINDSALVPRVRPLLFKKCARYIEQWMVTHCTGIVYISNYFLDLSLREYGTLAETVICPNAADITKFDPYKFAKHDLKKQLGLEGYTVCGYIGSFTHWHGIDWLVEEIAPRIKAYPDLVLLLVGDGVCLEQINTVIKRENVERQIVLTGRIPHEKIPEYLAVMDFGILPDSNTYGSPMKLFEFMAMECGMVIPAFAPIEEVVIDNVNSWLFPAEDKKACVEKLLAVSKQKHLQRRVGKNARQYIKTERQWIHNAQLVLSLIK